MKNIVENPNITQLNEIIKKKIDIQNKKYGFYQNRCVLKLGDDQYITCKPISNLGYIFYPNRII